MALTEENGRTKAPRVVFGLDLGFSQDFTALAGLEQAGETLRLRGVRRFALGTPFKAIITHVSTLFLRAPKDALLVVDSGGLGRPVVEYLRDELGGERGRCVGVQITSGMRAQRRSPLEWSVPKFDLVRAVQVAIETKRLIIPPGAEGAQALKEELQDFKYAYTTSSRPRLTFNARAGSHDDLVVALALGVWGARNL